MATTFKAVRIALASLLEGITPDEEPQILFREISDRNDIDTEPQDQSLNRKFQIDSGGISGFNAAFSNDLVRDSHKLLILKIAYHVADDQRRKLDMADEDENLVVRTFTLPTNRPSGVCKIELEDTSHDVEDGRRIVTYNFDVLYNHQA